MNGTAPGAGRTEVPVTVVAGFLGAGKTSLVNRILADGCGRRLAVIVNDFGSVNIDARLIVSRGAQMIALDNGCVCCSMSNDLVSQLTGLLEGPEPPEHVLVETSGVSDPGRLLVALRDPHLRRLARIDGVVTLVDAAGIGQIPPEFVELARRQLASADLIVLNKADLVPAARLAEIREWLSHPRARIVTARHADVPATLLLGVGDALGPVTSPGSDGAAHTAHVTSWTWSSGSPLTGAAVREILTSLPPSVYRAKGFLHLVEQPGRRVVAHVVGGRVDFRAGDEWGPQEPSNELVFISLGAGCDPGEIDARLDAALVDRVRSDPAGAASSR
jgi:G3E family GTPase